MDFSNVDWQQWQKPAIRWISRPVSDRPVVVYDSGRVRVRATDDGSELRDLIREAKADTARIIAQLERVCEEIRKLKKAA